MDAKEIFDELTRTVGPEVTRLGLSAAVEKVGLDRIVRMLQDYVDSLEPSHRNARVLSIAGRVFRVKDIPEMVRKDPQFREALLLGISLRYQHFLLGNSPPASATRQARRPERLEWRGKILVTDCSDWGDLATTIGGDFMRWLREWLEDLEAPVVFLQHKEVVREVWDETLRDNPDIVYISHMGHGDRWTVTGYDLSVLARVHRVTGEPMYDPALYRGKGSSWLSCSMGRDLLESFIAHGMAEGDGYRNVYYFYWGGKTPYREDPYARSFLWTHLLMTRLMAQGFDAGSAFNSVQSKYYEEAKKWDRTHPDLASVLLYDMAIHCLLGNEAFVIVERERVPTRLSLQVTAEPRNYEDRREVLWTLTGSLTAGDGEVLSDVPVHTAVGDKTGVAMTDKLGAYRWETVKEYPPEDVEEDVEVRFDGIVRGDKFYTPSHAKRRVRVPLERERTWFDGARASARWVGLLSVVVSVEARLMAEAGPLADATVLVKATLDGWYFRSAVARTDKRGRLSERVWMFPCPLSWRTWLAWLLGAKATVKLEYYGDWGHEPAEATVSAKLRPVWLPQ